VTVVFSRRNLLQGFNQLCVYNPERITDVKLGDIASLGAVLGDRIADRLTFEVLVQRDKGKKT
jgi:hypothetical protein